MGILEENQSKMRILLKKNSKEIKFKKIITIDSNETMYKAFRKITKHQITCILVKKKILKSIHI